MEDNSYKPSKSRRTSSIIVFGWFIADIIIELAEKDANMFFVAFYSVLACFALVDWYVVGKIQTKSMNRTWTLIIWLILGLSIIVSLLKIFVL